MSKRFSFFFLLLMSLCLAGLAQTPTTQGTEFWLSYMKNGHRPSSYPYQSLDRLTLIISSKSDCVVTVSNYDNSWTQPYNVSAGEVLIEVMPETFYNDQQEGTSYKGIYVVATDTVSLYIGNEAHNSYDAANVLPVGALGKNYMIQTDDAISTSINQHNTVTKASFLVVAVEDQTSVEIIPTAETNAGHQAGVPYSMTLNRGQVYHVMTKNGSTNGNHYGDFSGTIINADKPIAVFNGDCLTAIPGGTEKGYDHVFEQAMPTDYWGKRFVVTSSYPAFANLDPDLVKITALNDNTVVYRDGGEAFHLNAGQSDTFWMDLSSVPCTYLESNNPVSVFLYNHSHRDGDEQPGDPSMVWISPVEQTLEEVTFSTFQVQDISSHYVNVVCYSEYVSGMTMDGQSISGFFHEVPGMPDLSYSRKSVEHGVHTLRCPGGFVAHVYGIGIAEGYAYTVGSSAKSLTKQLYVDDILSSELPDGYSICQGETVNFRVETNYEFDHVAWDFGDGAVGDGAEVSHGFNNAGDPVVEAVVYRELDRAVQPFDTLQVDIHVHPNKEHHLEPYTTCMSTYVFDGHSYQVPGTYDVHYETVFGCDSVVYLHLEQGSDIHHQLDPVITCDPTYQFDGHTYDVPGDYEVVYPIAQECDSIVHLHLEQGSDIHHRLDPVITCDPTYRFDGHDYPVPGQYEVTYQLEMGCDSIVHLYLEEGNPYALDSTVSTCADVFYYDDDHVFDVPGDYEIHFQTMVHRCDSIIYLHIEQKSTIVQNLEHVACEEYTWYDVSYTTTNHYIEHLVPNAAPDGCDSLYILDLTIVPNGDQFFEMDTCDVYHWMGEDYDQPGVYTKTILGDHGCESHMQLTLTLHPSPPFEQILGRDVMTIASNFWPGEYVYFLDDSTGMNTDNIHWELIDNPGWILEPNGASCMITAIARGIGVLHVWTTGENFCDAKEAFKTIACGGYVVEEHESIDVEIYPNPATDELFVKGEDVERVQLFNLLGQKIKEVEVHGDAVTSIPVGDLAPTLYLVEVQTKKGNKTQLVSVTQ